MTNWRSRSGVRLLAAATELAGAKPIHELTVAALCQAAGVTRDTFYRYAARPIDVLAEAMHQDLPSSTDLVTRLSNAEPGSLEPAALPVLEHVQRQHAIYRNALHPHLDSALREVLHGRIVEPLLAYLELRPRVVPEIDGAPATPSERRRMALFLASGVVGAIEDWVGAPEPDDDAERMLAVLFATVAPWWRTPD